MIILKVILKEITHILKYKKDLLLQFQTLVQILFQSLVQTLVQILFQPLVQTLVQILFQPLVQTLVQTLVQILFQPLVQILFQPLVQTLVQTLSPTTSPNTGLNTPQVTLIAPQSEQNNSSSLKNNLSQFEKDDINGRNG